MLWCVRYPLTLALVSGHVVDANGRPTALDSRSLHQAWRLARRLLFLDDSNESRGWLEP